jgi:hypothetical protein
MSKYVPIQLDKSRNFRFGMVAVSLMEETMGVKINKLDIDNLSMKDTATVMWAGLVHEDKDLTPEKVMHLIDEHSDLPTVSEAMAKAFEVGFSGKGKKGKKEKTKNE